MTAELLLLCLLAATAGAGVAHVMTLGLFRAYEWAVDRFFPSDVGTVRVVFLPTISGS